MTIPLLFESRDKGSEARDNGFDVTLTGNWKNNVYNNVYITQRQVFWYFILLL